MAFKIWVANADPATANLTIEYTADTFSATLSEAIPSTGITINSAGLAVTGFTDGSCNSLSGETDSASADLFISAGNTSDSEAGNFGFTNTTTHYHFNGTLTINGNTVNDGDTITIGGTQVTVGFPQSGFTCDPYFD